MIRAEINCVPGNCSCCWLHWSTDMDPPPSGLDFGHWNNSSTLCNWGTDAASTNWDFVWIWYRPSTLPSNNVGTETDSLPSGQYNHMVWGWGVEWGCEGFTAHSSFNKTCHVFMCTWEEQHCVIELIACDYVPRLCSFLYASITLQCETAFQIFLGHYQTVGYWISPMSNINIVWLFCDVTYTVPGCGRIRREQCIVLRGEWNVTASEIFNRCPKCWMTLQMLKKA